ncbi:MAG: SMC-Scp complex subunit ScpB [Actinomycetota bacterium]|nr:SMC-Scp complex subunit ScpB [Actinomycetota bacterium]
MEDQVAPNGEVPELDERTIEVRRAVEAILMVAVDPVPPNLLAQLLEVSTASVEEQCAALAESYEDDGRGYALVRVGGGYRFQSHPDQAPWVERFVLEGQTSRLTAAALETLAIVAYKQPISRAQVSAIRGVDAEGVLRTLQQRGWIDELSRDPGPGNAILYGTTREFLERMGLDSAADLPPLGDFVPGPEVVEALEHGLMADSGSDMGVEAVVVTDADSEAVVGEAQPVEAPEG